ncbi:MlaD family protein [Gordonia sp. (in: high G+C Gram-positive bacteria)]|jgi:phospholipid/cholesterol/gamma-HCH transport system substrate-binding protein|uniref:MlaD family protein n=1 Tax=Gordonia sp. (in: high G+C Gram-positive bacteria) TaxID=84139 RepID=UPI001D562B7C|nr:MlaD family protein [Gordonia sp. (in: high G+C Gram-positive bacteria)]MCB1293095.1 MCE family protein [Gordonia sp. (in: high G+C Gram-positive bacteria)]HMS74230.1 MlaD family protein [Gordonia sp. (in: high G+C Gram-positive bacteria)]HQV17909.1 MlaD family protein [Gordonia sp. (in: high G+C Gram-positive bacteria)]
MRITRFVRTQLIIFGVITVIAVISMAVYYIRIPSMFGIGSYKVTLNLPSTGGLYQNANVSFRGVNVGKVTSVRLTGDGVAATLVIDSGTKIPASMPAAVRSVSAIGEQYVEFAPVRDLSGNRDNLDDRDGDGRDGDGRDGDRDEQDTDTKSGAVLRDGSVVSSDNVPMEIATMLDQAEALLDNIGSSGLRTLVDEAFTAFNGTGEQLQRLLDSMALFVDEADKNSQPFVDLIDQTGPLLATQSRTTGQIRAWTRNVTKVTDQLRANRPEITDILRRGPGVAEQSRQLFASLDQSYPLLVSNLGVIARTQAVYLPNMRQIVTIYPRLIGSLITALNTGSVRYGANVTFALGINDRAPCSIGYLPKDEWRWPSEQNARELPSGMLCRVPQNSNIAVRGARNYPCVEFPGRRAPTPAECRTGYKPDPGTNDAFRTSDVKIGPASVRGEVVPGTPSNATDEPSVYSTTYDPVSGDFIGPDGKTYNAGTGQQKPGGSATTWQSLISRTVNP